MILNKRGFRRVCANLATAASVQQEENANLDQTQIRFRNSSMAEEEEEEKEEKEEKGDDRMRTVGC